MWIHRDHTDQQNLTIPYILCNQYTHLATFRPTHKLTVSVIVYSIRVYYIYGTLHAVSDRTTKK